MYKRQIYQIAESNRVEKIDSIARIESNRIETFFCPNWNALVLTCTFTLPLSGLKLAFSQIIPSLLSSHVASYGHFISGHVCFMVFVFTRAAQRPRYASPARLLAMALCLSVCLYLSLGVLSKQMDEIWHGGFFQPVLHCVIRKFWYPQKMRVLPSGTFS